MIRQSWFMEAGILALLLVAAAVVPVGLLAQEEKPDTAPEAAVEPKPEEKTIVRKVVGKGVDIPSALNDALRIAVYEAVGMVVEAETRVKNDKLIDDKILVASNSYVTEFKRLGVEEKEGLTHVTIKATIERADLIEGLRKLKITTTTFDPKALLVKGEAARFSDDQIEEMSKEEILRNKTEILHDLFLDYPQVLEARAKIPDRFDYDANSATLKMIVRVNAENELYDKFLKRLAQRLDKLCLVKGSNDATASPKDLPWLNGGKVRGFQTAECTHLSGPDLSRTPDAWCLWIMTKVMQGGVGTRWTGYILDADVRKVMRALQGELRVDCELLDEDENVITTRSFDLTAHHTWLAFYKIREKSHLSHTEDESLFTAPGPTLGVTAEKSVNVFMAPTLFQSRWEHVNRVGKGSTQIQYVLAWDQPLDVKLELAEFEKMKNIKCTVVFQAAKP